MSAPIKTGPRSRWRWLRLSLRGLMILVLLIGAWLGWLVRSARIQREAVAAVERGGGSVLYDWQWSIDPMSADGLRLTKYAAKARPSWPRSQLIAWLGPDLLANVKRVTLGPREPDRVMAEVGRLQRLGDLWISFDVPITDAGLRHLDGLTSLEFFSLLYDQDPGTVSGAGLKHLEGLYHLRSLRLITTRPLTDADLAHLKNLGALQILKLVGEADNGITDAGLANLAGMTDMRVLDLDGQPITSAGLVHLRGMTRLDQLILSDTEVESLAPIAHLNRLTFLLLENTPIDDDGLAPIARFTALRALDLTRTRITDAGLKHLAGLTALKYLSLDETQIHGDGLKDLNGLKNLTDLHVDACPLTDAARAAFLKAHPRASIQP